MDKTYFGEMTLRALTPEYLDWYAKLVEVPSSLTDKIRLILYRAYTEETGLDPWIMSETPEPPQIEKTDNYLSQDCVIKISKFPEEKSTIHEAVHKRFPFLSYTNSNAWHRDVFKYTDSEAKCPVCKEVHTRRGIWGDWSCLGKNDHYFLNCPFRIDQKKVIIAVQSLPEIQIRVPNKISNSPIHPNKTRLYQYAIEHGMDPENFSIITEAEKNRWAMGCFRGDLERDIRFYRGGIESKEDPRKYHKFLTDRDRLIGEELLRRSILKSGLSTAWLDDLMKEWEEIHTQFKKDIIAIQEKLGIISNINQTAVTESKKSKNLAVSYELLLKLVGDLILIQEKLGIDVNPVLEVELRRDKASSDKPIRLFDLLLSLEDDIVVIQDKLGIIGYSNQERAEEVDENVRAQLQKLEEFHGPLEDDPGVILPKYGEMGVKKFRFTGEGLPLFPNLTPQQFHEIFVKKSASDNQCPCLEQVS
ncbi:3000_t:CDS:2 [Entrophospora sp. SA101]|nr:3000_t:CDS:2 [Entrophospora sp. SA101]